MDSAPSTHETALDPLVEEVRAIFSENGRLSAAKGFEYRPEQQQMAVEVAQTLTEGSHLIVEAGTGVGKSLAYLIPAALFSVREQRKAVICTHTINLQEQLIYKDIPLVQQALGLDFDAVLLKGRQNYLCGTRLDRVMGQTGDLFLDSQREELERIREWSFATKDGTLSDFSKSPDPGLWAQISSERHACTKKSCANNPRCFYQAIRRRALAADILILNHTLFFTLLGGMEEFSARPSGFLTPGDFAIFDEAHTVEAVASRHLGIGVSQYGLRQTFLRLYNPKTKKGLLSLAKAKHLIPTIPDLLGECDDFFEEIGERCTFKQNGRECRIRKPGLTDATELLARMAALCERIETTAHQCGDDGLGSELLEMVSRIAEARVGIHSFLEQNLASYVYWVEQTGKRDVFHNLNAVPINLAELLSRLLFRPGTPSVLTSATLSVGSPTLDYFRDRVGGRDVFPVQIGSPFDFEKQMTLYLVRKMPEPKDPTYEEALEKWIAHFTEKSQARAFVLFTSYRTMNALAERMKAFFQDKNWDLLVQSDRMPRNRMLEEFRNSAAAVLFGTESFWTGVDVAGDALSNVIITRLPFATPDHPIVEAKIERIQESGGDAFFDYSLPEAILRFRQGFGRLIRTQTDTGSVVILDSRILSKAYGKSFLKALPKCHTEII